MANSKQKTRSTKGGKNGVGGRTGASTRRATTPDFSDVPF